MDQKSTDVRIMPSEGIRHWDFPFNQRRKDFPINTWTVCTLLGRGSKCKRIICASFLAYLRVLQGSNQHCVTTQFSVINLSENNGNFGDFVLLPFDGYLYKYSLSIGGVSRLTTTVMTPEMSQRMTPKLRKWRFLTVRTHHRGGGPATAPQAGAW